MADASKRWPLVEVIAEFRFSEEFWSEDLPDRLYQVLKDRFPVRRSREMTTHTLLLAPDQSSSHVTFERHQFFSRDEICLVQINRGLLSINHLRPYSHWSVFRPLAVSAYKAFLKVVPAAKSNAITLTYINRIDLDERADIDDYFEFRPNMEENFIQCGCMATHPWTEGQGVVMRQMQTQAPVAGKLPVSLVLQASTDQILEGSCQDWLENAHEKLNQEFKSSITAATCAMFEEKGEIDA